MHAASGWVVLARSPSPLAPTPAVGRVALFEHNTGPESWCLVVVAPGPSRCRLVSGLIGSPGSVRTHAEPRVTQETRFRSQAVRRTPATRQSNRTILAESPAPDKF